MVGSQFELGGKPMRRNVVADWDAVRAAAVAGDLSTVPSDIFVRHYFALQRISADNSVPIALERECMVYWGNTGTGKSRRAWEEAGMDAYAKDPRSKWCGLINRRWCGYRGQKHVILDEFRGTIDVSHILRWLDRYPVSVEVKGGSRPLCATKFWITSNVDPRSWYPDLDAETLEALLRRLNITHFN